MAAVVLPLQAIARANDWPWQTMVFTTLALLQLGHALAVRSERRSVFQLARRVMAGGTVPNDTTSAPDARK